MTFRLLASVVLDNTPGNTFLTGPTRFLGFGLGEDSQRAWLIKLARPASKKKTQRKGYSTRPFAVPRQALEDALEQNRIYPLKLQSSLQISDEDRLSGCSNDEAREKVQKALDLRDSRMEALKPLVYAPSPDSATTPSVSINVLQLIADKSLGARVAQRATELSIAPSTLYNWLHRYLAGGSQKNALFSDYSQCGNPGQSKPQRKKLGRRSRLFNAGLCDSPGYFLNDEDKQKLAWGFRLISPTMPARDAYVATCSVFWAEHRIDSNGSTCADLFPIEKRPSFAQFMRWGCRVNVMSVMQIILGTIKWRQTVGTKGGSEQDSIAAVGQQAQFDGTTTDLYLSSLWSRLKKLPPATRLILRESRVGVIFGVYCGWEPASPATALQAILHGAMPCKRAWGLRYGVDVPEGAIPGLVARMYLADNGELKAEAITEAEEQFGFGVAYTPIRSGDRKGSVESQHRKDHAHLDHRITGTTHGKPRERGEDHPAALALWNYDEYMRELILYIVWHNTIEEVPDLAPDDMLLVDPPIKPTRMNSFRWLTDRSMNVSLPVDHEALRAFTLPTVNAVVRKNGIYLEEKVHGRKVLLPRLRYTSDELVATGLLAEVQRTGKVLPVKLKIDRTDLSQAWLPTKAGLIRIAAPLRHTTLCTKLTLEEYIQWLEQDALRRDLGRGEREQQVASTVVRRLGVTAFASEEARAQAEALGASAPTKTELSRNLDKHKQEEMRRLREQDAKHERAAKEKENPAPPEPEPTPPAAAIHNAADAAMDAFHAEADEEHVEA